MKAYAIIPDIHADPERLEASLRAAGYAMPVFLGDFIDAGKKVAKPDDAAVLKRVRDLVDAGKALAVMGNHELSAILFHTEAEDGEPLRKHDTKNRVQHASFIETFGVMTREARELTAWFLTLPLWLEVDGMRLVHAAWEDEAIGIIRERRPDARLHEEDLPEVAAESTAFGRAVKRLLNGPEVKLPDGGWFHDAGGHVRHHVRLAWWRPEARTWRDAALSVPKPEELPESDLPADVQTTIYDAKAAPVFVGHYKMKGAPRIEAPNAVCLDYPETPCIYLWAGEEVLRKTSLREV